MDPLPSVTDIIDTEPLESFIIIGYEDYNDLLQDAIQQVPEGIESIRAGVAAGDHQAVKARAHSLKGMLSYFGCKTLTSRLQQLEDRPFAPGDAPAVQAELLEYWEKSLSALRQWEKSVPGFAP